MVGLVLATEPEPPPPDAAYPLEAYAAVGSAFARNTRLAELGWSEAQFEAFVDGLRAGFRGQPRPLDASAHALHEAIGRRVQQIVRAETEARRDSFVDPARLESYMKQASKHFKMERTDSGLAYLLANGGSGSRPGPDDTVVLTYKVTAADGKTDLPQLNTLQRRSRVADLLPGLAEAVQMMAEGGAALLIVPPDLSYGAGEWPAGVDRGSPLLFTLVLDKVLVAP